VCGSAGPWRALTACALALTLGGCSFASDSLWPSLSGEEPAPPAERIDITADADADFAAVAAPRTDDAGAIETIPVTDQEPTGTMAGAKVGGLRQELGGLQETIRRHNTQLQEIRQSATENSQRYYGTVAAINTRLQMGTTPGNPVLIQQWNAAQTELDRIGLDITKMASLSNQVASDSALAAYLLESTRAAYGLSGAVEEDHRQLAILEDETNRTAVLIDRLLNELSDDIGRQTTYVGNERRNLAVLSNAIKNGELFGPSLANRAFATAAPVASRAPAAADQSFAVANRRPLVVIRFDRPDVPYQQALYSAVSEALERRPDALFDLVAVSPVGGSSGESAVGTTQARRYAGDVLRSLTDMGLPASRVNLSALSSPDAATSEVHLYVR